MGSSGQANSHCSLTDSANFAYYLPIFAIAKWNAIIDWQQWFAKMCEYCQLNVGLPQLFPKLSQGLREFHQFLGEFHQFLGEFH